MINYFDHERFIMHVYFIVFSLFIISGLIIIFINCVRKRFEIYDKKNTRN